MTTIKIAKDSSGDFGLFTHTSYHGWQWAASYSTFSRASWEASQLARKYPRAVVIVSDECWQEVA